MLKPKYQITIEQQGEGRDKTMYFDFVNHWEYSDSWVDLTNKGSIIFPKNISVIDEKTNIKYSLNGKDKFIKDIFKRLDKIKIEAYIIHYNENLLEKNTKKVVIAQGYITNVLAKMPIQLEFEDAMFLLKQIPMKNQSFPKNAKLEDILTLALNDCNDKFGTKFKTTLLTATTINFDNCLLQTENESVAVFLDRLRKDYFLDSYFRNNELRIGSVIYVEKEAKNFNFHFQENIITSDLEYKDKDDVVLSAVASNHIQKESGETTKDGKPKRQNSRIEVLVTIKNNKVVSKLIKKGDKADPNVEGERRTFVFLEAKNEADLVRLAAEKLIKFYYTGFKGKFTTFGEPHVQFGDNAVIQNKILPDQNGIYKIKSVEYRGGVEGYRQNITLDFKINE